MTVHKIRIEKWFTLIGYVARFSNNWCNKGAVLKYASVWTTTVMSSSNHNPRFVRLSTKIVRISCTATISSTSSYIFVFFYLTVWERFPQSEQNLRYINSWRLKFIAFIKYLLLSLIPYRIWLTNLVQCLLRFLCLSWRPSLENSPTSIDDWLSSKVCSLLEVLGIWQEALEFVFTEISWSSSSASRSSISVVWRRFRFIGFFS